jgi:hypothetical protein
LSLNSGQARSTAVFQLATDLPAGDWAAYAAEVSRRQCSDPARLNGT